MVFVRQRVKYERAWIPRSFQVDVEIHCRAGFTRQMTAGESPPYGFGDVAIQCLIFPVIKIKKNNWFKESN